MRNIFYDIRHHTEIPKVHTMKRRNKLNCKYWKPRGKKTHYCTVDENDPLKQCYGVCKKFIDINLCTTN